MDLTTLLANRPLLKRLSEEYASLKAQQQAQRGGGAAPHPPLDAEAWVRGRLRTAAADLAAQQSTAPSGHPMKCATAEEAPLLDGSGSGSGSAISSLLAATQRRQLAAAAAQRLAYRARMRQQQRAEASAAVAQAQSAAAAVTAFSAPFGDDGGGANDDVVGIPTASGGASYIQPLSTKQQQQQQPCCDASPVADADPAARLALALQRGGAAVPVFQAAAARERELAAAAELARRDAEMVARGGISGGSGVDAALALCQELVRRREQLQQQQQEREQLEEQSRQQQQQQQQQPVQQQHPIASNNTAGSAADASAAAAQLPEAARDSWLLRSVLGAPLPAAAAADADAAGEGRREADKGALKAVLRDVLLGGPRHSGPPQPVRVTPRQQHQQQHGVYSSSDAGARATAAHIARTRPQPQPPPQRWSDGLRGDDGSGERPRAQKGRPAWDDRPLPPAPPPGVGRPRSALDGIPPPPPLPPVPPAAAFLTGQRRAPPGRRKPGMAGRPSGRAPERLRGPRGVAAASAAVAAAPAADIISPTRAREIELRVALQLREEELRERLERLDALEARAASAVAGLEGAAAASAPAPARPANDGADAEAARQARLLRELGASLAHADAVEREVAARWFGGGDGGELAGFDFGEAGGEEEEVEEEVLEEDEQQQQQQQQQQQEFDDVGMALARQRQQQHAFDSPVEQQSPVGEQLAPAEEQPAAAEQPLPLPLPPPQQQQQQQQQQPTELVSDEALRAILADRRRTLRRQAALDGAAADEGGGGDAAIARLRPAAVVEAVVDALVDEALLGVAGEVDALCEGVAAALFDAEFA